MAKTDKDKKTGSTGKASAKSTGSKAGFLARSSRGEDKRSATPRGTVSTKPVGRARTFFREVRIEMKKVTWPPRKELIKSTGVVIVAVLIAAIFIGGLDALWNWLVGLSGLGG
jgi:preprotein translocase subunit SecE